MSCHDLVRLRNLKADYTEACRKFGEFIHEHAADIWEWRKTGIGDEAMIAEYDRLCKETDTAKELVDEYAVKLTSKRRYIKKAA